MVIYSVSQINNQAKLVIETKFDNIWVRGEITSLNTYPSGHTYFTIRDNNSELSVVNFNSSNQNLNTGNKIILSGKLSIYTGKGRYQFIANNIYPDGDGQLWLKYEELKNKLTNEGIFDSIHKLPIPNYPNKVGIISSEKGAVIWDMINFFKTQAINLNFILNHVSVQGHNAPQEIINGINNFKKLNVDIIIIARGGGSIDDLWCFNDESLVLKIFETKIPIISAIGHETDFTLCDFVSDYRAPTPSYAAELISRNYHSLLQDLDGCIDSIDTAMQMKIFEYRKILQTYSMESSIQFIKNKFRRIDQNNYLLHLSIINKMKFRLEKKYLKVKYYENQFKLCHPNKIFNKGFVIAKNSNNQIIKKVKTLSLNENINITFQDGSAKAIIKKIEQNDEK